ncbi:MAG: hypothetical protein HY834_05260 [Devosia nanyangense]|uniref:Uncharacterized protein n=1 Tax=Devosia nanyangense TaxID=1228055 RepID=A0A933L0A9_9HYPH|nr:hypothetical protein [Devosia nanyangense]
MSGADEADNGAEASAGGVTSSSALASTAVEGSADTSAGGTTLALAPSAKSWIT